ncbi:MAG: beta-N-acetylhexosaminidase [Planctomycetota bacterium]
MTSLPSSARRMTWLLALGIAGALVCARAHAQSPVQTDLGIQLIPQPVAVERLEGWFLISDETRIHTPPAARDIAEVLACSLERTTEMHFPITAATPEPGTTRGIVLRLEPAIDRKGLEGYRLEVTPHRVLLEACDRRGLVNATQTLRQLLPLQRVIGQPVSRIDWIIPCVSITDYPRFGWRGLMLDCSRTFQSVDYLRATIDRMAFYKLNVLHLHLTDDQGWRLEIRQYPELTAKGARFPERFGEPDAHQGFYTQAEMAGLVKYAAERNITIVPEIEMPGHCLAALACYPELSCTGGPFEIHPFLAGPAIHEDVFCAGNDKTFAFLENVLAEVIELFPSKFIHIGGDEVPKKRWHECPRCQARMKTEGLVNENELQSYFIRRIEKYLNSKGRVLIGWDEILEGGLAPHAAVMSWRGTEGGIAAAQAGHDVVMSPFSHCYFDYPYATTDTRLVFAFEPVPDVLDEAQAKHILGLQGNFWSHIDREPAKVDAQIYPRLLAIAERGWSPREQSPWDDFQWRLRVHLVHLDDMAVHYHRTPPAQMIPPVGSWTPAQMNEEYVALTWDMTEHILRPGRYRVRFQYTQGAHRLGIEKVELLLDGKTVSSDEHRGMTGYQNEQNEYLLTLEEEPHGKQLVLRASARSEGGTDSNGVIYLSEEKGS